MSLEHVRLSTGWFKGRSWIVQFRVSVAKVQPCSESFDTTKFGLNFVLHMRAKTSNVTARPWATPLAVHFLKIGLRSPYLRREAGPWAEHMFLWSPKTKTDAEKCLGSTRNPREKKNRAPAKREPTSLDVCSLPFTSVAAPARSRATRVHHQTSAGPGPDAARTPKTCGRTQQTQTVHPPAPRPRD